MNAFLLNGTRTSLTDNDTNCDSESAMGTADDTATAGDGESRLSSQYQPRVELKPGDIFEKIESDSTIAASSSTEAAPKTEAKESSSSTQSGERPKICGPDPTKPLKLKAKFLRAQRKLQKQQKKVADSSSNAVEVPTSAKRPCRNIEQTLQSLINAAPTNGRHNLQVECVPPPSPIRSLNVVDLFMILGKAGTIR